MKFIHIADVHLGAKPDAGEAYSYNREREIWDTFNSVLRVCEKKSIELLLIAGDLFHRQPLLRELKEIDYMFSKLSKTKVVFVAGNHDYMRPNSYYGSFVWSDNVYPILSAKMDSVEIEELGVAVYGCSYHSSEVEETHFAEEVKLEKQKVHILLAHGGDATHMPFKKEEINQLPYDYIALGHIHKPQILIEHRMAYAGALEPTDIADIGPHGYMLGEIVEGQSGKYGNDVKIEFVPYAKREYRHLQIQVNPDMTHYGVKDTIYQLCNMEGMQHLYHIELVGKREPEIVFHLEELDDIGNIINITDNSKPDYNMDELAEKNKDNLLGAYIRSFGQVEEGSVEYLALYEGVQAIEETKKG